MNTAGVWTSLWKAIGLVSVASVIFACVLSRARNGLRFSSTRQGVREPATAPTIAGIAAQIGLG